MKPLTLEKSENGVYIVRYSKWNEAAETVYATEFRNDALALVAEVMGSSSAGEGPRCKVEVIELGELPTLPTGQPVTRRAGLPKGFFKRLRGKK